LQIVSVVTQLIKR